MESFLFFVCVKGVVLELFLLVQIPVGDAEDNFLVFIYDEERIMPLKY